MSVPELNRMVSSLVAATATQGTKIESIERDLIDIKSDIKEIRHAIAGNGVPGLSTRLDRIEQRHSHVARVTWLLVASFVGLIIEYVWSFRN